MKFSRVSPFLRVLHWSVVVLTVALLITGIFVLARFPDTDPSKLTTILRHMVLGFLVCVAVLIRMSLRFAGKYPPPVLSGITWVDLLAKMVHWILDFMAVLMAVTGVALALQSHLFEAIQDGNGMPANMARNPLLLIHAFVAGLFISMIFLHVAGALFHRFILRERKQDNTLVDSNDLTTV
ncbi:MAG: hypothetical protein CGU28_04655 [Candidatus Dactylopiibacterium carminicum]|uniref:Cytochrome b561 bacterial/Ni-hydrogenase domain-containing protein n=1 Tax=Candidatus Dactylopiibacterium carminicum TaxID=857335 RepID=A0A272EU56_9RHOO|nr:cytochrome b/b6 domain-containing protein [Candidatus Dactylopiibacterium carminicum]KAF7599692.1 hypothetical protein BGI27_06285 [Candidatus Dactylopiibacterium carminicum]PAS93628.1 MAG: hypothetical protein CGU29_06725 [Candidatus Dactylopiibacterium carminicum]PAS97495.1 MAG: hypothetical protein CGU28_04655 [Candidatus Dactylopiibacterium carminicum]PAS99694.1 MAG: hypothetical protein BSR46_06320 [Candidatus Dactylopiibacterium carminicum]